MPREAILTPRGAGILQLQPGGEGRQYDLRCRTIGVDVATGEFAGPTVQEQARRSLPNCQAILRAGGAELGDAVMVHTLLRRTEDADGLVEVFNEFFPTYDRGAA